MKKIDPKGNLSWVTYICDWAGVGYIRTIMPSIVLGGMQYKSLSFTPVYLETFIPNTNWYNSRSFIKFQRAATSSQVEMIKNFQKYINKQTKTPAIYDIDDLVFNIPESNYAHSFYKKNEKNVEEILKTVDGLVTSTEFLKNYYSYYNSNISVSKNRLPKCLWGDIKYYIECNDKPKIVYPASQNHFSVPGKTKEGGDIDSELMKYIQDTKKKYEWVFIGGIPEDLFNDKDITYISWIPYILYPYYLKNLNADIGIAPLEINDFNRAKSNIKMLEYCASGIPGVYTDIEPYKNCRLKCKDSKTMVDQIEWLVKNPQKRGEVHKTDTNTIKGDLFLEDNYLKYVNEHLKLFSKKIKE